MLDRELIRNESERVKRNLARRDLDLADEVEEFLRVDKKRRSIQAELDELRAEKNTKSKKIGQLKQEGKDDEAERIIDKVSELGDDIESLEDDLRLYDERLKSIELSLPNLVEEEVPQGEDAEAGEVVERWGEPREFDFEPKDHLELGEDAGVVEMEPGARVSGHAFYFLSGWAARLQRALGNFMLDYHTSKHGYREVYPPVMVRGDSMVGTGQLPKFSDEMYYVDRDDLWLIPTAEVSLTNHLRETILDEPPEEPIKMTARSQCFRREAGSHGSDVRGLLRVHQFEKVELVNFTLPEQGREQLDTLVGEAEAILKELDVPFRRVLLPSGDMTFGSAITYDLEVWLPAEQEWTEVSSASWYRDFQARRADIRYRPEPEASPKYLHTLNASGLAMPRLIAAIMENNQRPDGSVDFPAVLDEYLQETGPVGNSS